MTIFLITLKQKTNKGEHTMNKLKINWAIRCKSKVWWIAMVSATLLLIQTVAAPFGYSWDFVVLNQQLTAVVNAAFAFATLIGVVNDPTTKGLNDSEKALTYKNFD